MKKTERILSLAALLLASLTLLSGCATTPEYTRADNLFKGVGQKAEKPFQAAKLCILLTNNVDLAMNHVNEYRVLVGSGGGNGADFDTKKMGADLVQLFDSRFRETVKINALDEAKAADCNLAIALDLKIEIGSFTGRPITVDLLANVVDKKGASIDSLSAAAHGSVPFLPSFNGGAAFLRLWDAALSDFGKTLQGSAKLGQFVAGLPNSVAPPAATPAIDLAFWDSIKTSNNPADFQAYLRKFPNGSFESLARTRLSALGEAQPARQVPPAQPVDAKFNFGNYYALVIGNDNYRSVTPLKTAVKDARSVADLLQKEYGFKVSLLVDATRNQMLDAFDDMRRKLGERDNLLIYYAGHGYLDSDSDRGFWLPVDADAGRRANWLSNSDLADFARGTRAKHVLVVADSCYAGTLTRSLAVQMTALDDMSRLSQKRARTALVSGGLEPVEDSGGGGHSVFAKAFLDSLMANTGITDMSQLFSSMRRQVILGAQQTPQYGDIRQTGHEGGDFIFVRRR